MFTLRKLPVAALIAIAAAATSIADSQAMQPALSPPAAAMPSPDTHSSATRFSGWAVVNSDGSLARGRNVKSAHSNGGGDYSVTFTSNVSQCAFTATVGLSGNSGKPAPGYTTVVGSIDSLRAVVVDTFDSAGTNADSGFHLNITC